ncbi:MAG: hypothetical protein ACE5OR_09960 [bacterium]
MPESSETPSFLDMPKMGVDKGAKKIYIERDVGCRLGAAKRSAGASPEWPGG